MDAVSGRNAMVQREIFEIKKIELNYYRASKYCVFLKNCEQNPTSGLILSLCSIILEK